MRLYMCHYRLDCIHAELCIHANLTAATQTLATVLSVASSCVRTKTNHTVKKEAHSCICCGMYAYIKHIHACITDTCMILREHLRQAGILEGLLKLVHVDYVDKFTCTSHGKRTAISMHVCVHVCIYVYTCVRIHAHISVCIYLRTYVCTYGVITRVDLIDESALRGRKVVYVSVVSVSLVHRPCPNMSSCLTMSQCLTVCVSRNHIRKYMHTRKRISQ
jgi:hypothetical protein